MYAIWRTRVDVRQLADKFPFMPTTPNQKKPKRRKGESVNAMAKRVGMPETTLRRWFKVGYPSKRPFAATRTNREQLANGGAA